MQGGERGKDGKGFSLGVGVCTSVRVSTRCEDRPLQLSDMDESSHTLLEARVLDHMVI